MPALKETPAKPGQFPSTDDSEKIKKFRNGFSLLFPQDFLNANIVLKPGTVGIEDKKKTLKSILLSKYLKFIP